MTEPLPGYDPENPPPARLTPAQEVAVEQELAAADVDTQSLLPAILAVLAAYLAYRAAKGRITGSWQAWVKALKLTELAGEAMAGVARRAFNRHVDRSTPRHAEDLRPYEEGAVAVSTDTQLRTLVHALQHYQRTGAVPSDLTDEDLDFQVGTKKPGARPQDYRAPKPKPTLPGTNEPPVLLAEMMGNAGRNSAQLEGELELARAKGKGSTWKTWVDVSDSHVRPSHQFLGSGRYEFHSVPISQPFRSIFGFLMNFPGDASLGAPLSELANCFVAGTEVAAPDVNGAYRAPYSGELVTIRTRAGRVLTGTPNHPMLTERGWVGLGQLDQSDRLICQQGGDGLPGAEPDVEHPPALIHEVFGALAQAGVQVRVGRESVNFYGDRPSGEVDVVGTFGPLRFGRQTAFGQELAEPGFVGTGPAVVAVGRNSLGAFDLGFRTLRHTATGDVGGQGEGSTFVGGRLSHPRVHGGGAVAWSDPGQLQASPDGGAADTEVPSEALFRLAGYVTSDQVVDVQRDVVTARHVYTLSTTSGIYLASGIVTHNCRCTLVFGNRSKLDPDEPQYLPAYWIHKGKGDAPHNEAEYRAELQRRYDEIMERKKTAWAANPKLAAEMALEEAKRSMETPAETKARHIAEAAKSGITYVPPQK